MLRVFQASRLIELVRSGMSVGRAAGGASILDLHSGELTSSPFARTTFVAIERSSPMHLRPGAVSHGEQFIDVYRTVGEKRAEMLPSQAPPHRQNGAPHSVAHS
jgi:hypothetical protein